MLKLLLKKLFFNTKTYMSAAATLSMVALVSVQVHAFSPENEMEVKDKLSKILASGEFGDKKKSKSLFELLHDKLIEFLKSLWSRLNIGQKLEAVFSRAKISPEAKLLLKVLAILLMVAVIVLIIYFVTRRFTRSRKVLQEEDALILNALRDADEVYKKAIDFYNSGDYTQGLRFLYISLLIRFNEQNIIRINKSKTNKQYLIEIRENKPDIYDVMTEFTQVFNKYWYGKRNADKSIFVSWSEVYNTLLGMTK